MSEHVLVVGSGRDLPTRLRGVRPGTETSVICRLSYVAKLRELTDHRRVIAVRADAPDEEWIALAAAAHAQHPFTRIATFGERDQDRAAALGEALGLATHSRRTIALVHDKHAMRAALREAGVDPTASALVTSVEELAAFAAEHGVCIVKPVAGSGSEGITRIEQAAQAAGAYARARAATAGVADGVLVEQFHTGPQFSVEALSEAGEHQVVAVTRKYSDPDRFVELGHLSPAPLDGADREAIDAFTGRVLDTVGLTDGATHTEIVLTGDGPRVIETHARMGGDEIPALAADVTGVDIAECVLRQTLGEKVLPEVRAALAAERPPRSSAIWFAALAADGELAAVDGLDQARAPEAVSAVEALVKPGTALGGLDSSASRVAYARAQAATGDAALAAARAAVERLEFTVRAKTLGADAAV